MKHFSLLNSIFLLVLVWALSFYPFGVNARQPHWSSPYNITWTTPSANASQSMPLGGGDIGCNVWVENGDLLFYIQRSGCFSENGEYLKLGRVRVRLSPNPFSGYSRFEQTLNLHDGAVTVSADAPSGLAVSIRMWVDLFTHSVHVDLSSNRSVELEAFYENWRTEDRELTDENRERFGCFSLEGYPGKVVKRKDHVSFKDSRVLFYHRNPGRTLSPDVMVEQQEMSAYRDRSRHPILV